MIVLSSASAEYSCWFFSELIENYCMDGMYICKFACLDVGSYAWAYMYASREINIVGTHVSLNVCMGVCMPACVYVYRNMPYQSIYLGTYIGRLK